MTIANVIKKRSRTYVIERTSAVTTDPQTGRGSGGAISTGSLRCHIQGYDGPRRSDGVAGVGTQGMIKIWVSSSASVVMDDASDGGDLRCDPGEGGSGSPADVIRYDNHRWLVIERTRWADDGSHRQYLARDEGAV